MGQSVTISTGYFKFFVLNVFKSFRREPLFAKLPMAAQKKIQLVGLASSLEIKPQISACFKF